MTVQQPLSKVATLGVLASQYERMVPSAARDAQGAVHARREADRIEQAIAQEEREEMTRNFPALGA